MKGPLERQFNNPDIKRILRPRHELDGYERKVNWPKACAEFNEKDISKCQIMK